MEKEEMEKYLIFGGELIAEEIPLQDIEAAVDDYYATAVTEYQGWMMDNKICILIDKKNCTIVLAAKVKNACINYPYVLTSGLLPVNPQMVSLKGLNNAIRYAKCEYELIARQTNSGIELGRKPLVPIETLAGKDKGFMAVSPANRKTLYVTGYKPYRISFLVGETLSHMVSDDSYYVINMPDSFIEALGIPVNSGRIYRLMSDEPWEERSAVIDAHPVRTLLDRSSGWHKYIVYYGDYLYIKSILNIGMKYEYPSLRQLFEVLETRTLRIEWMVSWAEINRKKNYQCREYGLPEIYPEDIAPDVLVREEIKLCYGIVVQLVKELREKTCDICRKDEFDVIRERAERFITTTNNWKK